MGPHKISFLYNGAIFHFHDYGRKGTKHTKELWTKFREWCRNTFRSAP